MSELPTDVNAEASGTVKEEATAESVAEIKPEQKPEPAAKPKTKKRKKKTSLDYAIEFGIKIAVTAAAIWVLCAFVVGIHVNHGNSSYPMLKDGDLVITYRLGKMLEGEEICYRQNGQKRFGRIVARGGDVVDITESGITVNGYGISEEVVYQTSPAGSKITYPYTVPANSVFVLNDFRQDLTDSRSFGAVSLDDCEGGVVMVLRRRGI